MSNGPRDNLGTVATCGPAANDVHGPHGRPDGAIAAADEPPILGIATIPGLKALWSETLGDPQICVAILDGPVDRSHPALAAADLTCLNTLVPCASAQGPAAGHGTHITSVIFGQHDGPVKGIAPGCRGLIVPVFQDGPDGGVRPCSQVELARAIGQAADQGAHVINVSGGQFSPFANAHPALADVVRRCAENGILIVAAAGNQGCECLHVPGALPSVLAVGAMDAQGKPLEFSNWGTVYQTQGVVAPGQDIPGAAVGGSVATNSGTSFATPIVSGVAALLLSMQAKRGRKPDVRAVRRSIVESALGCDYEQIPDCRRLLAGRLNVQGAMSLLNEGDRKMSDSNEMAEDRATNVERTVATSVLDTTDQAVQAAASACDAQTLAPASHPGEEQEVERGAGRSTIDRPRRRDAPGNAASTVSVEPANVVKPASCSCGGSGPLVYALGALDFDLGSLAREDSIAIEMESGSIHDKQDVLDFLAHKDDEHPFSHTYAQSLIWTLNQETTPIYAIRPCGAFAAEGYEFLRGALREQIKNDSDIVAVPGIITGSATLFSGQTVPTVCPEVRGLRNWTVSELCNVIKRMSPKQGEDEQERIRNFLTRIYYEFRNMGQEPQDRALNFTGTNAFVVAGVFELAVTLKLVLDDFSVERSPICRPDSDCWDVRLVFFSPENLMTKAREVFRFTVDVSDVVPVIVGDVRQWSIR